MDAERWQNIERLYHAVLECEESQRAAFLTRVCGGDENLRREVESLVAYGRRSERFIEGSALEVVAPALAGDAGAVQDHASVESRMIGKRISQYRIVEQLGSGGMGEVYRAARADDQYQKQVAIKLVRAGADSGLVVSRFKNERQILASLDHPNIARLLDGGATEEGVPYFVMELVEGQPIDKYCDSHQLGIRARLELFLQVCSALKYSHQHQIIHRDIKPANILVTAEGVPKLLDFGIAKMVDSGLVAGAARQTQTMFRMFTPEYASPEQIKAEAITTASDVYSLGVLLYELLTGHRPYWFKSPMPAEIERAICEDEPLKPSIVVTRTERQSLTDGRSTSIAPEEIGRARGTNPKQMRSWLVGDLDSIVMMALRKEAQRRYASVDALSEDIRKHLEGLPIAARPSTVAYRGAKFVRRHRELVVGALVFFVLLSGLAVFQRRDSKQNGEPRDHVLSRQLTASLPENPVRAAAISRDGRYLAYSDSGRKMSLLQIDSGEIRQLPSSDFTPIDWFPDGSHVLVSGRGQHPGLWKMSIGDGATRRLTERFLDWKSAAISPDGSYAAYLERASGSEIWLMGTDGQEPHRIADFDSFFESIAWSPGGRRLVYTRLRHENGKVVAAIETCDVQGDHRSVVLSESRLWGPNGLSEVYWLPDGRIIYNLFDRFSYPDSSIWAVAADPESGKPIGHPARLANVVGVGSDFRASADGGRLIYGSQRQTDAVYLANLDAGVPTFDTRRLTLDGWDSWPFDWTRDSKAVLFQSIRSGRFAILQQRIDRQAPEILLSGAENYLRPIFSPASDRVLYTASPTADRLDPFQRLMSMPTGGGAGTVLLRGNYTYHCASVPSAGCVLAEAQGQEVVFSFLDPVAGKGTEIQHINVRSRADWSLSPDGSRIAITEQDAPAGEVKILTLADHKLLTLALQGVEGEAIQSVAWAADGNHLFATVYTGSSFVILFIDLRGKARVLTEMPIYEAWPNHPVASPDGHYLAYMKRTFERNVVMLEHF